VNLQNVRAAVNGGSKQMRVCTSCIRNGKILKAAPMARVAAAVTA
jgi:large subunit ribosomal protein L28